MSTHAIPSLQALQSDDLHGSDEVSPKLWPTKEAPFKAGPKPKKNAEDLYSLYENMGNGNDLTFKDMCGHIPQKKEEQKAVNAGTEPNVDFTEGLAAVQSAMATHALCEAPQEKRQRHKSEVPGTPRSRERDGLEAWQNRKESVSCSEGVSAPGDIAKLKDWMGIKHKGSRRVGSNEKGNAPQNVGGGAPHTKYCCICNKHALFLKTRCLVCGRCYCINCVKLGMGNMPEGRKCKSCLGRRFNERYIERAGKSWFSISSEARMAEIKWARKGPQRRDTSNNSRRQQNISLSSPYHSPCHPTQLSPRCSPQFTPPRSPFGRYAHQTMEYAFV